MAGNTKGTFRRGAETPFKSEFVDDGSENPAIHRYKDDKGEFSFKFKDNSYKLAFFHLLLPHAMRYCREMRLKIPKEYKEAFKRNIMDRDPFSDVFDVFEATTDASDMISKEEVMFWMTNSKLDYYQKQFKNVLHKFKSKGIEYKSQHEQYAGGKRIKGWFFKLFI